MMELGRRTRAALLLAAAVVCAERPAWARFQPVTCKNAFTVEQEQTEGAKVAAQVYKQMPVLPDSDPISRYVQGLGAKLVEQAPGYKWQYNFHIVASEDINAFALPGGSIFVNLGTIQAAETEAQLAGVMAHEISHVVMRHSTCNITKAQTPKLGFGIASVLSSIVLGDSALASVAQGALGLGANATMMKMSRDAERQADLLGAGILYDAGYDPRGLPQFFETIKAKYGEGGLSWFSDHPDPGNRTEAVNKEIATLPRRAGATVTTAEFTRIHALGMQAKVYSAKDVEAGVWRRTGLYASGPGAAAGMVPAMETVASGAPRTGSGATRLSGVMLGSCGSQVRFQGSRFSVSYPPCWKAVGGQDGSATVAPPGGSGSAGLTYGAVIGFAKQGGDGVSDAATLSAATMELAQRLSKSNGGLQQVSKLQALSLGGQMANAVELRGRSGVVEGGAQLAERDWLVAVARPDGDLNYIVFVAPEPDFEAMRPAFTAMMQSFRAE
ncbi:M48 family metallopeptidase [Granulicella sp. dw_53]|uniref:M48 family metallopeptidase n=1 Tax=Granulicella sp. dw_53 TaxID=2719792 RepID=UPI002107821E|nr:M48 family metallopeptidase [Granulicella sp. dw_53]